MKNISPEQVIIIHDEAIKKHGGESGLRDRNLLESAVYSPYQTFDGVDLFPSICDKAARLSFGLIKNHPFLDGNKRVAAGAMLTLLIINNIAFSITNDELEEVMLSLAAGMMEYHEFAVWLNNHVE